jgi:hypothetical protein
MASRDGSSIEQKMSLPFAKPAEVPQNSTLATEFCYNATIFFSK